MRWWLLALGAAGCSGDPKDDTSESPPPTCDLVWERDVVGFFQNWCTPCHSATVGEPWRQDAPLGVNFDTLGAVQAWAPAIELLALGEEPTMPPIGGPSDRDRELVAEWIACGMPGTDIPDVGPCDGAVPVDGDHTVRTQSEADALCEPGGTAVLTGTVLIDATGPTSLGCVCAIEGDLVVGAAAGQAVGAPLLTAVGGALNLVGTQAASLDLPELRTVGGGIDVSGQRGLTELVLPNLRTVGGAVIATDLGPLASYRLPMLLDVGGTFVLADANLTSFEAPRMRTVGGDARFERLPGITDLETLQSLANIAGDLVIEATSVPALDDMRGFEHVSGSVRILGNPGLTTIHGFWWLLSTGGIEIADNPQLTTVDGFDLLESVPSLEIRGSPSLSTVSLLGLGAVGPAGALTLIDVPALTTLGMPALGTTGAIHLEGTGLTSLSGLASVASLTELALIDNPVLVRVDGAELPSQLVRLEVRGNAALDAIDGVAHATGISDDLLLVDNPELSSLGGLALLATVGGDVELSRLGVDTLTPLFGIESVGGDLTIRDNPRLRTSDAQDLADAIETIGGAVIISGNLP